MTVVNINIYIIRLTTGVGGVKVSMVAFQAVDPGSIPGRRNFLPLDPEFQAALTPFT